MVFRQRKPIEKELTSQLIAVNTLTQPESSDIEN